jgi:hypothetical protein
VQIENNRGERIITVQDWADKAPPASKHHWSEYRSAYELAHAWVEGDARERLSALLDAPVDRAIAERKTSFDHIGRGPRNHDLLVLGDGLVVGVEAKADETFDKTLSAWAAAGNPGSRREERIALLTRAFFDTTRQDEPELNLLRYQLFSALAGTLADAKTFGGRTAALVVHEFDTPLTTAAKHAQNDAALESFVRRFGDAPRRRTKGGWLAGPFHISGNAYLPGDIPIHIGKLRTQVVQRGQTQTSTVGEG